MKRKGFTLVEVLVVIGIVALLAAIILPVLSSVRARGRQAVCVSNLKQLGVAVALYAQDYDDLFPRGADPTDINTDAWARFANGEFENEVEGLRPLTVVLRPYVKNKLIWRCPADIGFDDTDSSQRPLNARPTSYDAFGTSYYYRTELTLRRKKDLLAWEPQPPHTEHGPSDINVLFDGHGTWHGGWDVTPRRYNVLFGDGHVKNLNRDAYERTWKLLLDRSDPYLILHPLIGTTSQASRRASFNSPAERSAPL